MKEFKNIVAEYEKIADTHETCLATVVKVRGSSYRSPGARMLIRKDGRWTGSISGGCLEGDALRKARKIMASGQAELVTYDTMDDANNSLGVGLGCNGIIDVLIEPIDATANNPIARLKRFSEIDDLMILATVFRSSSDKVQIGEQMWLNHVGEINGEVSGNQLQAVITQELKQVFENKKPKSATYLNDQVEVFYEFIEPSIDLIIFGGGFDAKPVSAIATTLGWDVTITDECIAHVAPVNFPDAQVAFCKRENFSNDIPIKPFSAAVLMSHTYDYDLAALKMLLKTNVSYIGILGPKKRTDKMYQELEVEGVALTADDMSRIHSPIGLDIGAETPEEIALSVITEIQAKFRHRSGGFLKYRQAPIHHRDGKSDQIFKQVFLNTQSRKQAKS